MNDRVVLKWKRFLDSLKGMEPKKKKIEKKPLKGINSFFF